MNLFRSREQRKCDLEGRQMFYSIDKINSFLGALSCATHTEVGYATRLVKSTVTVDKQPIPITQEVHVTSTEKAGAQIFDTEGLFRGIQAANAAGQVPNREFTVEHVSVIQNKQPDATDMTAS